MTFSAGVRRELVDRFSAREESREWAIVSFAVLSALSGSVDRTEDGWLVSIRTWPIANVERRRDAVADRR